MIDSRKSQLIRKPINCYSILQFGLDHPCTLFAWRSSDPLRVPVWQEELNKFELYRWSETHYQVRGKTLAGYHAPVYKVGDLVRLLHLETNGWYLGFIDGFETLTDHSDFGLRGSVGMRIVSFANGAPLEPKPATRRIHQNKREGWKLHSSSPVADSCRLCFRRSLGTVGMGSQ